MNFMSGKYFLDTNMVVYSLDRASGEKHARALVVVEQLWNSGEGVISTQVLQEAMVYLRRRVARPLSARETRDALAGFFAWEVIVNTQDSVLRALEVEERYKISFWDALIVQAAQVTGAVILYSEDLADGQSYGSVRVVNPVRS